MSTPDFVRARLTEMIDLRHPMAVLAGRLHLAATEAVIEAAVAPKRVPAARRGRRSHSAPRTCSGHLRRSLAAASARRAVLVCRSG